MALVGSLLRAEILPKTRIVDETLKRTNEKHSLVAAMRDGNRGLVLLALPTIREGHSQKKGPWEEVG